MTGCAGDAPSGAPWRAALAAGVALGVLYAASAAPDVTFWDAGEFLAAFATFGVPHPPGTPLYVALGRAWTLGALALGADPTRAGNLLSGACTAAAGACTAWLVARWTRSGACGVAAALCAGAMTTAWANATEAEVYAAALALACAALVAGEWAGARPPGARAAARGTAATAYALALAVPLHLTALVASPAAIWLASAPAAAPRRVAWRRGLALLSGAVLAAGAGTARPALVTLGGAGLVATALLRGPRLDRARGAPPLFGSAAVGGESLVVGGAVALALSAAMILLVRARYDPWLNQGDPSTWARFVDVIGRRQYDVSGPWPRQAPWWLQLANLGEWADWQVALGLAPGAAPSAVRTACTLAYAALGAYGAAWHRRRDPRSWTALLLLCGAGSLGVAVYLNLKAGPSFGWGVLADTAPHEARERDYFFALGWWTWGIWAGIGCVAAARAVAGRRADRVGQGTALRVVGARALGVSAAALPAVLNWSAASRARAPEAGAAAAYARALLENAPARAVLVVSGDNDTYPLWFAQVVRHVRLDVTVVTASLLPAGWYRAELARRAGLLPPAAVSPWLGAGPTLALIADHTASAGRPLSVSLAADEPTRAALARTRGAWVLRGLTLVRRPDGARAATDRDDVALAPDVAAAVGATLGDRAALAAAAARAPHVAPAWLRDSTGDGVAAWAYRQLACPAAALASASPADARSAAPPGSANTTPGPSRLEAPCRAR